MTRGTIDSGPGNGAFSLVKKKKEKGKRKKKERNFKLVYKALFFSLSLCLFRIGVCLPLFPDSENWILSMLLRCYYRSASSGQE